MAKILNNMVLHGVSGGLGGQVVVRQTQRGGVLAANPKDQGDREPTPAQREQRERFRQALAYGRGAQDRDEYQAAAETRKISAFNVATADFLHPPEITEVDAGDYAGHAGEPIHVRAIDDVQVREVRLSIVREDGSLIEAGQAVRSASDLTLWTYTANENADASHVKLVAEAVDLAGRSASREA